MDFCWSDLLFVPHSTKSNLSLGTNSEPTGSTKRMWHVLVTCRSQVVKTSWKNGCKITTQQFVHWLQSSKRQRWAGGWKPKSKISAEQILHSILKQRKWSIGHVAIRKFHAVLTQSSCLPYPDWTVFCPETWLLKFPRVFDVIFLYLFLFISFFEFTFFVNCNSGKPIGATWNKPEPIYFTHCPD